MKFRKEKTKGKSKERISSILMYIAAVLTISIGIASLVNNVLLFNSSVTNYVAQGYTKADVLKQMIPGQLLPSIFEACAVYGGIAVILISAGIINKKLTKTLELLTTSIQDQTEGEINIIEKQMTAEEEIENHKAEELVGA